MGRENSLLSIAELVTGGDLPHPCNVGLNHVFSQPGSQQELACSSCRQAHARVFKLYDFSRLFVKVQDGFLSKNKKHNIVQSTANSV